MYHKHTVQQMTIKLLIDEVGEACPLRVRNKMTVFETKVLLEKGRGNQEWSRESRKGEVDVLRTHLMTNWIFISVP